MIWAFANAQSRRRLSRWAVRYVVGRAIGKTTRTWPRLFPPESETGHNGRTLNCCLAEKPIHERRDEDGQKQIGPNKPRPKERSAKRARTFRRSSAAVATSREGQRLPRSGREGQHRTQSMPPHSCPGKISVQWRDGPPKRKAPARRSSPKLTRPPQVRP